jgi:RNA polymerase sigma factor (TIGR02999 family)
VTTEDKPQRSVSVSGEHAGVGQGILAEAFSQSTGGGPWIGKEGDAEPVQSRGCQFAVLEVAEHLLGQGLPQAKKAERAGHVLQTTALVNEVYLKLFDVKKVNWQDRAHFFAISAKFMRQILVHMARSMDAKKRGGQFRQERLDEAFAMSPQPNLQLPAVDEALSALAALDARSASVVELRF